MLNCPNHTTGLEPATFRSLVRRATSSATEPTNSEEGFSRGRNVNINLKRLFLMNFIIYCVILSSGYLRWDHSVAGEMVVCCLLTAEVFWRPCGQMHASNGKCRVTRDGRQMWLLRHFATSRPSVPKSTSVHVNLFYRIVSYRQFWRTSHAVRLDP